MKVIRLITGGIVMSAVFGPGMPLAKCLGPTIAVAADPGTSQPVPDQNTQTRRRSGPGGIQRAIDQLNLTDAQKPVVDTLLKAYHEKEQQAREELLKGMKETLTPAQYEALERSMTQPPPPPPPDARPERGQPPAPQAGRDEPAARTPQPVVVMPDGSSEVEVTLSGGYETDPRDGGRPVVLVAAALNVPSEIFRKAFTGVKPAGPGEQPEDTQVRKNKQALLSVLEPLGVTNDRLDTVSNYYRYSSSRGQMWRNTPATAKAIIRNGAVTGFVITNPGSGYSSAPVVSVPGMPDVKTKVTLTFGTDFKTNGSIKELTLATPDRPSGK